MHNECDEGNCTECSVGQDKTLIPQPAHHLLATQHQSRVYRFIAASDNV
jgi:hypothetical protein